MYRNGFKFTEQSVRKVELIEKIERTREEAENEIFWGNALVLKEAIDHEIQIAEAA